MNISNKIRHLILGFLLFAGIGVSSAQYVPLEEVISGDTLVFPITSLGNSPTAFSKHGSFTKKYLGGSSYEMCYVSDSAYLGLDTLNFNYWTSPWAIAHDLVYVNVVASQVSANSDYIVTNEGVPIEINVLENDESSNNFLELKSIPVVSHGYAFIVPDSNIYFSPDPGFIGFASLNYIVCDDIGTCDAGTLTISVVDNNPLSGNDSIYVNTLVNNALPIPLSHDGYEIVDDPTNGTISFISSGVIEYTPNNDYTGSDDFLLKKLYSGVYYYRHFFVDVLPLPNTNNVAFDDYAYTPVNTAIEINVTNNDLGNYAVKNFTQATPGGTVEKISGSIMKFTPDTDFEGLAEFTYTINIAPGSTETATVFVTVDDQEPQDEPFELYTNKNTTLVLYYDIPIDYTEFTIINDPSHGQLEYIEGDSILNIGSQSVPVSNAMLYHPDIDYVGDDEFEINYCVTVNGSCYLTKIIAHVLDVGDELCASNDCVWPGDGNNDGIANMVDLLHLGKGIGEYGAERTNPSIDWFGQFADEWGKSSYGFSQDMKYIDMDGSGFVDSDDLEGLNQCYNLTHHIHPEINPYLKEYPIILVPTFTPPLYAGDLATFDIYLGETGNEAINIYGITYSFGYDPAFVDESTINIDFEESSWIYTNNNSPVLTLVKEMDLLNRVDVGLTRTNGYTVSGAGKIASLDFIIDDDLFPRKDKNEDIKFNIQLNNIIGLDEAGKYYTLPEFETEVVISNGNQPTVSNEQQLILYPNPTADLLNIHLNGSRFINALSIHSITGQEMFRSGQVEWEKAGLSLENYSSGVYVVKATLSDGTIITKMVQVSK